MKKLKLVEKDPWLNKYNDIIVEQHQRVLLKERDLIKNTASLTDFATGYLYFGMHRTDAGWVFREWAPNADVIYLIGTFNNWREVPEFKLTRLEHGVWELKLNKETVHHGDLYKLSMHWKQGCGERIPAWTTRTVQDSDTHIFSAQVWAPELPYQFKVKKKGFKPSTSPLLIYECHIGMALEEERVGTYNEFRETILPRIAKNGYNAIQIMAIQEHPYYGSFGYHVSSFFAPSSRFGTPDELKQLIDEAHQLGLSVIMDLVHSHAVKNEVEGLALFDGSPSQYFHQGAKRLHVAWDSLCFDYGKNEVMHFLLSNCKYWLEVFQFDGFRFDGVTSMLYHDHGLEKSFTNYDDYYNANRDLDAIVYLSLANKLIHEVNSRAITIAEEMSGMPGLAIPFKSGGVGFDYRMAMGIPDFWIKMIKEKKDEDWKPGNIFWELINRREEEKTVNYVESHDQAMVGDKTVIFRLIDEKMYWHMMIGDHDMTVERGIALHKMIRLITAATMNGAYLNFMGNEFGHPEWIDFPREGNNWSYFYARRQWSLADNPDLKYQYIGAFDNAMINLLKGYKGFEQYRILKKCDNDSDQILAFERNDLLFVFNFNPSESFTDYGIFTDKGIYKIILNTDDSVFGGYDLVDKSINYSTTEVLLDSKHHAPLLKIYLPSRTAMVFQKQKEEQVKF